jgi:methylmalonyl-CoA mutase cobalamin-binding subunit
LQLIEAVIAEDPGAAARLLETLRARKIPLESLADHYLPEAARALGVLWSRDQADFVDVTIGTARLQALLRGLDSDAALDLSQRPVIGAVLMIVPGGEQHTFGALVAASKLRRRGISVCLRLMPRTNELRDVLRGRHFDGAMISVGARENLDMARKLVKLLRGSAESNVPVIVGGALLAECEDLARETGADAATNDLDRALALCGVQASVTQTAGLRARQG